MINFRVAHDKKKKILKTPPKKLSLISAAISIICSLVDDLLLLMTSLGGIDHLPLLQIMTSLGGILKQYPL